MFGHASPKWYEHNEREREKHAMAIVGILRNPTEREGERDMSTHEQ